MVRFLASLVLELGTGILQKMKPTALPQEEALKVVALDTMVATRL
jgi:hypothetical protein